MKKIPWGYWVAAGALLVWAGVDLYHYLAFGRDILAQYPELYSTRKMVYGLLVRAGIKMGLAALLPAVGRFRGREKHPLRAETAVTGLVGLAAFGAWLVGMYCLTAVTAEYAAHRYLKSHSDRATQLANFSYTEWLDRDYSKYGNYKENRFWEAVSPKNFIDGNPVTSGRDGFLERRDSEEIFAAAAIYDAEGNCLEGSWTDFFYFEYLTQEQWDAGEERSNNNARAFFDRTKLTEAGKEIVEDSNLTFDARALRFTGSFDGVEFTPTRIEYIDHDEFQNILWSKGSGSYTVSGVVETYDLPWITAYENPEAVPAGAEIITFYSDWFDVCYTANSPAFSYNREDYDNVAELLQELGPSYVDGYQNVTRFEGLDLLILSVNYCYTHDGETYYNSYYYGTDAYQDKAPELQFYIASAVYCSPWRTAFRELLVVYHVTFALAAALALGCCSLIRRHLLQPVGAVAEAMAGEKETLYPEPSKAWRESGLLQEGFSKYSDRLRIQRNEIARLNRALEYAKTAEENRRQMTSNIAHELKTPVAVIHSYAEGLKERIAEEKREKYIDVILSEAERTDGMVLEMLDLSRLEAGRVKLSRDEFSLISLTQAVFEKLEMAAREKSLQIVFSFPEEFSITADEARIAQVVENFATNAIKYTPAGGRVEVRIETRSFGTVFTVENDSEPLSEETLSRVWDTFYRADEARSGGGTGLGLAIAKNIVELHGGRCRAENTGTGVRFGFVLPGGI